MSFYVSLFCFMFSLSFPNPSVLFACLLSPLLSLHWFLFPHLSSHPLCSLPFSLLPFTSTPSLSLSGSSLDLLHWLLPILLPKLHGAPDLSLSLSALLYPSPYWLLRDSLSLVAWNASHILVTSRFVSPFRIFPLTSRQTYPTALFIDSVGYSTGIANLTCLVLLPKAFLSHIPLPSHFSGNFIQPLWYKPLSVSTEIITTGLSLPLLLLSQGDQCEEEEVKSFSSLQDPMPCCFIRWPFITLLSPIIANSLSLWHAAP